MEPHPVTTIPAALDRAAALWPDREALVDGETRLTWSQLRSAVRQAARALQATGIGHGDHVAIWAPNSGHWVIAGCAIHQVGAAITTMNTRFKGAEAAHNIVATSATLLFTTQHFLGTDHPAMLRATGVPDCLGEIVVLDAGVDETASPDTAWLDFLRRSTMRTDDDVATAAESIRGDDVCDVIFTSGTTGAPKGAMLCHETSIRAFWQWSDVVGLSEDDRYLIVNPFFHTFGLKAGILACMLRGATMVPHAVFDVPTVMAQVQAERITVLPGPPAIYQTILNHPDLDRFDLTSLRLAVTGAAPIPVELVERMRSRLGFETVVTGYGLTETHGIVSMNRHDDPPEIVSGTDGRPMPDVEAITVDDRGRATAPGDPGEIWVRGPNLMKGYIGDPDATADAVVDGWLHTGDIGVFDEAGNLRITDRLKDMVITGGFNVYPAEVEGILARHPDIAQTAVVGVPDERMGEVCVAFVVPTSGTVPDVDGLAAWARDAMANYKVPRRFIVVDTLPMNAANKVLKFELRDRLERA